MIDETTSVDPRVSEGKTTKLIVDIAIVFAVSALGFVLERLRSGARLRRGPFHVGYRRHDRNSDDGNCLGHRLSAVRPKPVDCHPCALGRPHAGCHSALSGNVDYHLAATNGVVTVYALFTPLSKPSGRHVRAGR